MREKKKKKEKMADEKKTQLVQGIDHQHVTALISVSLFGPRSHWTGWLTILYLVVR